MDFLNLLQDKWNISLFHYKNHGSGGGAFIIGNRVNGGLYSEYPSIDPTEWLNGEDMKHTFDYRGVYGTLLEQHLGLDPSEIVLGNFEQLSPFK